MCTPASCCSLCYCSSWGGTISDSSSISKGPSLMNQVLALGSDVLYQLSEQDAAKIKKSRLDAAHNMAGHISRSNGVMVHVGNDVRPGEICSARVVKCWDADPNAPGDGAGE